MRIGREKPYVIAEIGNNHQGDIKMALKMVEIAKKYCNVDAVKFQKRNNKELFTKAFYNREYDNGNSYGKTYGEHREFLEFGEEEYIKIKKLCDDLAVDLIVTPFEKSSLDFLEKIGVQRYKVASADLTNIPLIEEIAKLKKDIIISTGGSNLDDIRLAYNTVKKYHKDIALLHCVAKYPPTNEELNLSVIKLLKREFPDVVVGYSGHEIGIEASILANAMGANIIEKHFTLDKTLKGTDHKISLDPEELKLLVEKLQQNYKIFGNECKKVNDYEISAITKLGKSIYAIKEIRPGDKISADNICLKSPGGFLSPQKYNEIIGKISKINIGIEEPIKLENLK